MDKKLYKLHEVYGKHEFRYAGVCCGEHLLYECSCGKFTEQAYNCELDPNFYEDEASMLVQCMQETMFCIKNKRLAYRYAKFCAATYRTKSLAQQAPLVPQSSIISMRHMRNEGLKTHKKILKEIKDGHKKL